MEDPAPVRTVLCLASYDKGADFLREAHALGCHVILITEESLRDIAWPRESIDDFYVMPDLANVTDVRNAVSYLARSRVIDRIVPLDDYDVLTAAALREHLRVPGMGESATRWVRDKLAMRVRAGETGIRQPEFVPVLNYGAIAAFTERVPTPWVLKPRAEVSSIGIVRVDSAEELWARIEALGDRQSHYLVEQYVAGDVHHVDTISAGGKRVLVEAHQYATPPMDVFHGGGIAMSRTLPRKTAATRALLQANARVLKALNFTEGVSHAEFIRSRDDGQWYFLEIGARVGGANTTEMVEAATGVNLFREWARLVIQGPQYTPPQPRDQYAGVILSLARQEHPDTSAYTDPEIVFRLQKHHHVGFVVVAPTQARIIELQEAYSRRMADEFGATVPAYEERPPASP